MCTMTELRVMISVVPSYLSSWKSWCVSAEGGSVGAAEAEKDGRGKLHLLLTEGTTTSEDQPLPSTFFSSSYH